MLKSIFKEISYNFLTFEGTFIPCNWQHKKIIKFIHARCKRWIKRKQNKKSDVVDLCLIWNDIHEGKKQFKTGQTCVILPKSKLPRHRESYNPPKEYLLLDAEIILKWKIYDVRFSNLLSLIQESFRLTPYFKDFIFDQFERCLDLYLHSSLNIACV
jgi:ribosome biogenesis protein ERB1